MDINVWVGWMAESELIQIDQPGQKPSGLIRQKFRDAAVPAEAAASTFLGMFIYSAKHYSLAGSLRQNRQGSLANGRPGTSRIEGVNWCRPTGLGWGCLSVRAAGFTRTRRPAL